MPSDRAQGSSLPATLCHQVFERAPFGLAIYDVDAEGRLVVEAVNEVAGRLVEQLQRPVVGRSFEEAFPALVQSELPERLRRAARDGVSWTAEHFPYREGEIGGTYEIHTFQIGPGKAAMAFLDVTSRARADELLRQEEQRHHLLLRLASEVVWAARDDGCISYVSTAAAWLTDQTPSELAGRPLAQLLGAEPAAKIADLMGQVQADPERGRTVTLGSSRTAADGAEVHVEINATVIVGADDDVIGAQGTVRNVTAKRRAQLLSERLRLRNQMVLDAAGEGIFGLDRQGRFTFVNPAASDLLGFPTGELIGCHASLITAGSDEHLPLPIRESQPLSAAWYSDQPTRVANALFRRREGATIRVEYVARPIKVVDEPTGLVVVFADVTERRQAEAQLERLGMAIAQSSEVVLITDAAGTITYVNPAFERVTGYGCEEAIGRRPSMLKSGVHEPSFYQHMWETIGGGRTWSGRVVNRRKDGSLYTEEATISPVRDKSGAIINFVAVKRDVTHEIALAEQLTQSQKMKAIGLLAGGVAHDMNNILATVMVTATLVDAAVPADHASRADLEVIFNACRRGRDLAGNLLSFSGKGTLVTGPIDLNGVVRDTVALLERSLLRRIDLSTELHPHLPAIEGDLSQVSQALMNLCINAADAIDGRGAIRITTSVAVAAPPAGGRWVRLEVEDTGVGMDEDTQARVFEPFFTTKPPEKGTGLGLSMVYGTMSSVGGRVDIDSRRGEGTKVTLAFPALDDEAVSAEPPPSNRQPVSAARCGVLLVDDEHALLESMAKMLRLHGYQVWEAATGAIAFDRYRAHREQIDVVVLDLILPDMDGAEVLEELRRLSPAVKVLVSSGFAAEESVRRVLAQGAAEFLPKPFEFEALLDRLESILGGRNGVVP